MNPCIKEPVRTNVDRSKGKFMRRLGMIDFYTTKLPRTFRTLSIFYNIVVSVFFLVGTLSFLAIAAYRKAKKTKIKTKIATLEVSWELHLQVPHFANQNKPIETKKMKNQKSNALNKSWNFYLSKYNFSLSTSPSWQQRVCQMDSEDHT